MQHVVAVWLSIPAEQRGWLEFWAFCALVALVRWLAHRYVPQNNLRRWLEAVDLVVQFVTANSPTIGQRRVQLRDRGIPDVLLPRVSLPPLDDEHTPVERPSRRP